MVDGNRTVESLDAAQIAAALGITKRAINKRSEREQWPYIEQAVRGGRLKVYSIALLPEDVRESIRRHAATQAASTATTSASYQAGAALARRLSIGAAVDARVLQRNREQGAAAAAGLVGEAKTRMDAKLDLLARLSAFSSARGLGQCAAMQEFCNAFNDGRI